MDKRLLDWLQENKNRSFKSPRGSKFKTQTQNFEILEVSEGKQIVKIEFSKQGTPLQLEFFRFEKALEILEKNRGKWTRLGTKFYADDSKSIEFQIQQTAKKIYPNRKVDLKSAPHICDILVLSGIAEYSRTINPKTKRYNQAVKLVVS